MKINNILDILNNENIIKKTIINVDMDTEIEDITYNSKECKKNSCFFVKGKNFKEEYILDAISNGAILIISEDEYENISTSNVSKIIVKDIRIAMVTLADKFFERAYEALKLIGLTGTKGKTTTTYFVKNILQEFLGKPCGLISTIETYTGKRKEESHLTTPEAIELQRYFKEMKDSNIQYMVMEVASQAYKAKRIISLPFDIGVFLNISEDHISEAEHPNFNDYFNCKLMFVRSCKTIIINRETDFFETVLDNAKNAEKIITYSASGKYLSNYWVTDVTKEKKGFSFVVNANDYSHTFKISIDGRFNIENALVAIIISKVLDIPDVYIEKGLEETYVDGRMNVYEDKDKNITAIVDYAHNKLSFTKLYESLKLDYPGRRIITIAGGPGGKAYARRKDLGQIAGSASDYMYLTEEDPQFEKIEDICKDIATYVNCEYEIEPDRVKAIEKAVKCAKPSDVLVLLAKGEETYQKEKGVFVPYESDVKIIKRLFNITGE